MLLSYVMAAEKRSLKLTSPFSNMRASYVSPRQPRREGGRLISRFGERLVVGEGDLDERDGIVALVAPEGEPVLEGDGLDGLGARRYGRLRST
jgi:hypothetical protein